MLNWMEGKCGNIRISHGKKNDYLGMDIDYSNTGEVKTIMAPYPDKVIKYFPEEIRGRATIPTTDHMFKVRYDRTGDLLDEERAKVFNKVVTQILFAFNRMICDIQLAMPSYQ